MQQRYAIFPYFKADGAWSLSDEHMMNIFDRILSDGHGDIFRNGTAYTRESFLELMQSGHNNSFVLMVDGLLAGILWISNFDHKTARGHFCTFNGVKYSDKIGIFRQAMKLVLHLKDRDGTYLFDTIVGYTPTRLKIAIMCVKACGGRIAGTVPGLLFDTVTNASEEGTISYFTRDAYENLQ